jgi:hypothetical protein
VSPGVWQWLVGRGDLGQKRKNGKGKGSSYSGTIQVNRCTTFCINKCVSVGAGALHSGNPSIGTVVTGVQVHTGTHLCTVYTNCTYPVHVNVKLHDICTFLKAKS